MSWVLILTPYPHPQGRHPAVVGGYPTEREAKAAGRIAVFGNQEGLEEDLFPWGMSWNGYTVIPGAADTPPESAA